MTYSLLDGNEAIVWGAVKAGCNFFAGYPITPATSILTSLQNILPPNGGICVQGEDEIASIGLCLGASMSGRKTMTATSGPGISLYSENISFATGSEIPIVIVDVQRLGPSTGSATRGADGDIQFLRWGSSGGFPVIVLAPVDVKDCYLLTIHAFNLAEKFRCPVFIASNKEIAMTRENINLNALKIPKIIERPLSETPDQFLPFKTKQGKHVPDFLPIGHKTLVRQTSSTHSDEGYITTDADAIKKIRNRLVKKINSKINTFSYHDFFPAKKKAETLIITYGVTSRAARQAHADLNQNDYPVSLLVLKTLWPAPAELLMLKSEKYKRIVIPEMNMGQYFEEVKKILPNKNIDFFGQMDGRLITPEQIKKVVVNG